MKIVPNARAERRRRFISRVVPRLGEGAVVPLHERVGDIAAARRRAEQELEKMRRDLEVDAEAANAPA